VALEELSGVSDENDVHAVERFVMQDTKMIADVEVEGRVAGCASCDRLTFLKQSAAAIASLALAACGSGSLTAPGSLSSTKVSLASNPSLANVGGIVTLNIDGSPVAVVRESSTTFAAFSLVCPHQGTTVQARTSSFYCPGHGATFNLAGQNTGGQRTGSLHSYPAVYDPSTETVTVGG
jgi:Rieske Fe-S protein